MTEDEAQAWLTGTLGVSRETVERLDHFRQMVIEENAHQNLVSAGSIDHFWTRHIADSAQLLTLDIESGSHEDTKARSEPNLTFVPSCLRASTNWLDLGTGAGFPGMVIAILRDAPITMVESRRLRVEFLERAKAELGLAHATILCSKLEAVKPTPFLVISARAFAPLHRLLPLAHSFSTAETLWLLPKGRQAREEIKSVGGDWNGVFHVKQSLTDSESSIIVAKAVTPKRRKKENR